MVLSYYSEHATGRFHQNHHYLPGDLVGMRKIIHEVGFQSPLTTVGVVNRLLAELEVCNLAQDKALRERPQGKRGYRWIPLNRGSVKINVDAVILKDERKGVVATVCRDGEGHFVAASAVTYYEFDDPEAREALACTKALVLAEDCTLWRVQVASDCQNMVKNIQKMPRCSYMMIFQDIKERSESFVSM